MPSPIIEEIKSELPKDAKISEVCYEGSEIILYTENKEFFKTSIDLIKKIVGKVKKRIEVRADPSILLEEEKTEEFIKKNVPKDAGIKDIYFEPEFAKVVVHAEKPGLVIGKNGETLNNIRNKTFWTMDIKRAPVIDSEVIKNIRKMLHKESDYRKKFLHKLGEKIYSEGKEVEWIRATALGAFREVGRSCVLLQTPQSNVIFDCGLSVSMLANKPFPYLDAPEFKIQSLDAVILSHSHLDHCGVVPFLYEFGYKGPMYCTRPTRDVSVLLQLDYIQICQKENKKPLYTSKGIEEMIKHTVPLEYGEVTDITPDMRLTLQNAGHLLGSASCHVNVGDGMYNVLYTGDMKYENTKLFDKAWTDYSRIETLITEATYGEPDALQPSHKEGEEYLAACVKKTIERGGRIIIPSFAVGRAQDVIAIITETDIQCPVYLDGMLWDATAIHTAYPEFMAQNIQNMILHKGKNPFIDPRLKAIGSQKERQAALDSVEPCVVLATSGMLTGGPAMEYLQRFASDEKNMMLFVGYQAEGTMGRRIQKGWKQVQLDNGKTLELKLEIATDHGLSGHSDFNQLMNYIQDLKCKPRKVMTNHGDTIRCVELARQIHKNFGVETVSLKNLETIRFK